MMRVLMTGGSGFVGRNLLEYLNRDFKEEYEVCAPSSRELNVLDEGAVYSWLNEHERYDIVLHLAVYTDAVDKSKDASHMLDYNLRSFLNFYKYRAMYGRMFYAGSGAEYDKSADICSVSEADLFTHSIPKDPYGLMKYTIGQLIENTSNIYNLRIFGLFGKYEYPNRFITQMCNNSINGKPFAMRQNVYFDYLYIDDFCKMTELLMRKTTLKHKSYNMVSGKRISLLEILEYIERIGTKEPITVEKEGLNLEYTAQNANFMEEFPEYVFMDISEAIEILYNWYKVN